MQAGTLVIAKTSMYLIRASSYPNDLKLYIYSITVLFIYNTCRIYISIDKIEPTKQV